MNTFIFLSQDFYSQYTKARYPEIEGKKDRPYIQVVVTVRGIKFAVPLRSHINHPHALLTDAKNKCGADFSKAVVITDDRFIDSQRAPHIRPNEFDFLRGKEKIIEQRLLKYIRKYNKAKKDLTDKYNAMLYNYSTLKYFDSYIDGIE